MSRRYRLPLAALLAATLAACSSAPPKKVNPITRLPKQTLPVPPPGKMPAFGSDEFNRIKDTFPDAPPDVSKVPDAEPKVEPRSRYGNKNPYTVLGETYTLLPSAKGYRATGTASWYGKKFHGLRTSSGEPYDMYRMSAAHRTLPLPSYVRVTNVANGKSVIVKVNDRGPFHSERIMDLSYAAAHRLDMLKSGTARVKLEAIDPEQWQASRGPAATAAPEAPVVAAAAPAPVALSSQPLPAEADGPPRYFVQVGAFSTPANARTLQTRLLDLVYAPVDIAASGAPAVNRVQVGPFFTREDADKVSQIIRDNELGQPIVVTR